ncbi:MAG TPA: endonuclease III [Nannocystaceae bacterium]|nr:endonuclease III [Nannocystaceae bacterium]
MARRRAKPSSRPSGPELVDDDAVRRQLRRLNRILPDAVCALHHRNAFELLVATILSAQCTDKLVNDVTPALFAKYPDARALAVAKLPDVEALVRRASFWRQKSKNLVAMAGLLVERHGGEVPRTMDELVALPGVARKTANVVLGSWFAISSGIVVDTHVERLANRLGFVEVEGAVKIERALMERIPRKRWILFAHQLILHGRQTCRALRPKCEGCALAADCPSREVG